MNAIYISTLGLGILLVLLALPMMGGIIKQNRVYGFRTKKTLSDENVWNKANRFGGWALLIAGVVSILAVIVLDRMFPVEEVTVAYAWTLLGGLLVPLVVAIIASVVYLKKL